MLETGYIPTDWTIGIIKVLYKNKGDINDVNNYRGITLLSCLGKLFTSVLNSRLYNYLTTENILGSEQAGFRPKHSTIDHIFALHILSNYYINEKKNNSSVHLLITLKLLILLTGPIYGKSYLTQM